MWIDYATIIPQPGEQGRHGQDDQGVSGTGCGENEIAGVRSKQRVGHGTFGHRYNSVGADGAACIEHFMNRFVESGWNEFANKLILHWLLEVGMGKARLALGFLGEKMGCGEKINCGDYKKGFKFRQTA